MLLSIIIPCKNEAARLPTTLRTILEYVRKRDLESEIIVVDDGSRDRTADVLAPFLDQYPTITFVRHHKNLGKGAAIRTGVLQSAGDALLFTDADLSTPIEELETLMPYLDRGVDIVIGSRALNRALVVKSQPWYRQGIGRIGNVCIRLFLGLPYRDTQCGFKLFRGIVARELFRQLTMRRWSFDYEILYRAKRNRCHVKEVPVAWANSSHSTFHPIFDSIRCFFDLLWIKLFV